MCARNSLRHNQSFLYKVILDPAKFTVNSHHHSFVGCMLTHYIIKLSLKDIPSQTILNKREFYQPSKRCAS